MCIRDSVYIDDSDITIDYLQSIIEELYAQERLDENEYERYQLMLLNKC